LSFRADDKHVARALVAWIIVRAIESMGLSHGSLTPENQSAIADAKEQLLAEAP
jgi:hypothetical protein